MFFYSEQEAQQTSPIVTDSLVLHLDAGDTNSYPGTGTTWYDLSGNGNDGTLTNGPTYSTGNLGNFSFDGAGDFVDTGSDPTLDLSSNFYSISAWVKTSYTGDWQWIYQFGNHSTNKDRSLVIKNTGYAVNYTYGSDVNSTTFVSDGKWHNLVAVTTLTTKKIYVDGVLENSGSWTPLTYSYSGTRIAKNHYSNYYFVGNISQVSVYSRDLSEAEVQQNFNAIKDRFGL